MIGELDPALDAVREGFLQALGGPAALMPAEVAVVLVAVAWAAWIDARLGLIPDLVVGTLAGLALAKLVPFGAAAAVGGAAVGVAVILMLRGIGWSADQVARRAGLAPEGILPLGVGDQRLLAVATVLLGANGLATALTVAAVLLALDVARRERSVAAALLRGTRLGPHLAAGIACASCFAALRW